MIVSSDRPRMSDEVINPSNIKTRTADMFRAASNLRPEDWRIERELSIMKWFDYRFMSPLEATLEFVEDYRFVYRAIWKSNFDASTAERGWFADRREFLTFWNARVAADALGVRYRFFIFTTMEAALRRRKWKPPSAGAALEQV